MVGYNNVGHVFHPTSKLKAVECHSSRHLTFPMLEILHDFPCPFQDGLGRLHPTLHAEV